jgi:hypothetical protein
MRITNSTILALALAGVVGTAAAQVDLGRGGPVTTFAKNPATYPSVSALLSYNTSGTIRYFDDVYALNSGTTDSVKLVADPSGKARNVFRLSRLQTDPLWASTARTEVSARNEYVIEGVRWYAMSVYFPTDWVYHASPTVVMQVHTSQKTAVVSPPLAIIAAGTGVNLELNSNHRLLDGTDPATKPNSSTKTIRVAPLVTGKWYCFVFRADWNRNPGMGSLNVWLNGDNVYSSTNMPNSYITWLGNYPKTGLYMPGSMQVPYRNIYADFTWLGGPSSTMAMMYAKTPCGS